jgi:hypothetical protein
MSRQRYERAYLHGDEGVRWREVAGATAAWWWGLALGGGFVLVVIGTIGQDAGIPRTIVWPVLLFLGLTPGSMGLVAALMPYLVKVSPRNAERSAWTSCDEPRALWPQSLAGYATALVLAVVASPAVLR